MMTRINTIIINFLCYPGHPRYDHGPDRFGLVARSIGGAFLFVITKLVLIVRSPTEPGFAALESSYSPRPEKIIFTDSLSFNDFNLLDIFEFVLISLRICERKVGPVTLSPSTRTSILVLGEVCTFF